MSDDNHVHEGKTRKITAGFVFSWIFAVLVGLPGIMSLFEGKILSGILFILVALVLLPPLNVWVEKRFKFALSGGLKVIVVILLLMAVGFSLTSTAKGTPVSTTTSAGSTAAPEVPAQTPPMQVTADALYSAYNQNEVAADAKYKGNVVEVSGIINTIGKDVLNTPYVTLNAGEYAFPDVQCMFSQADESQLATLSSGQRITMDGVVSGESLTIVEIDGCAIVK